jgi:hypothetical protein
MYITLFHSQLQYNFVPTSSRTLLTLWPSRISFLFDLRTSAQHPIIPNHLRSCLEPVSQPLRTLTPATAVVCFVLGTASSVSAHHR